MWFALFTALVLPCPAAELTLEARVPTELFVDGNVVAKLYQPGSLRVVVSPGVHELKIFINGEMTTERVDMTRAQSATVVVGRTGISWPDTLLAVPAVEVPDVEGRVALRSVADEDLIVQIGNTRHRIAPGDELVVVLGPGRHPMSVRNAPGTVIWVRGDLHITGDEAIVQLSDGRMPEVLGQGGQFVSDGG